VVPQTACIQAKAWQHSGYAPLQIAVNIRSRDPGPWYGGSRRTILRETGSQASLLSWCYGECYNLATEFKFWKASSASVPRPDDFGTGYSSLGSIKSLPFYRLKIDRSFVRDLPHQADDRSLTRAIINMGRTLKLEILAEGVETYGQFFSA
jgi:EAL domain-containing protein (putative c-di-GMP-specific phosphodiesterase class I)